MKISAKECQGQNNDWLSRGAKELNHVIDFEPFSSSQFLPTKACTVPVLGLHKSTNLIVLEQQFSTSCLPYIYGTNPPAEQAVSVRNGEALVR